MARLIDSVAGHEKQIEKLQHLQRMQRWPQALLLTGPSGIGKKKLAFAFSQMLICEKSDAACGVCGPCLRVEKNQSESLHFLAPDTELSRPVIKVEVVRELLSRLSLAGLTKNRVVIIDQAQTMNMQAANVLLKTLEEPGENVYFILIGEDIQQFLPTIRSRVQVLPFSVLTYEQTKKIKPQQPDWAYRSCRGQLDRLELLTSAEGVQKRSEALLLFEQFCEDKEFLITPDWKTQIKDRSWAQFNLNCWMQIIRDLVVLKSQARHFILNTDQYERLKKLYVLHSKKLLKLAENLLNAEKDLLGNADPVLVFESLWVQYARMD